MGEEGTDGPRVNKLKSEISPKHPVTPTELHNVWSGKRTDGTQLGIELATLLEGEQAWPVVEPTHELAADPDAGYGGACGARAKTRAHRRAVGVEVELDRRVRDTLGLQGLLG